MASTGPNNAATFASDSLIGSIAITNPSNASLLGATAQIDHIRITVYYTPLSMPHNMRKIIRAGTGMSTGDLAS